MHRIVPRLPARIGLAFILLAAVSLANATDLDSNGMSAMNHARYEDGNCDEFATMQKSGGVEHDYIDQILAGKTTHPASDIERIREIRAEFRRISGLLGRSKRYRFHRVIDRAPETYDCETCDPPFTTELYELNAHYHRGNLIRIEWIVDTNWPTRDTTSVYFDSARRPFFAFVRRVDPNWYARQTRFYYDESGRTIAVATRGVWKNDACAGKAAAVETIRNYPAPLDERDNPIDEMDHLDDMICTAKNIPGCDHFRLEMRAR